MTFNPAIPQAYDRPSDSQPQLLTNFQQLNTLFDIDHITWNSSDSANRGKHRKTTLRWEGSDPATSAGEGTIYTKSDDQLYFRQQLSGTIYNLLSGTSFIVVPSNNGSIIFGGIAIKWGSVTWGSGNNNQTATFAGGAFSSTPWAVALGAESAALATPFFHNLSASNFEFIRREPSGSYPTSSYGTYIAVGPA